MRIFTTAPDAEIPIFEQVVIHITGAAGRRVLVLSGTVATLWSSYDNLALRDLDTAWSIWMNNGDVTPSPSPIELGDPTRLTLGTQNYDAGAFDLIIGIETGIETNQYAPLAESGVEFSVEIADGLQVDWEGIAPVEECFWEDLVRVNQVCGVPPPPAPDRRAHPRGLHLSVCRWCALPGYASKTENYGWISRASTCWKARRYSISNPISPMLTALPTRLIPSHLHRPRY